METVIVIGVLTARVARTILASAVLAAPFEVACAGGDERAQETSTAPCPVRPVDVVVSVDQWADIVSQLGGGCAQVATVLAGSAADPHDFEPAPSDAAKFEGAQLVVLNGGHYDEWAVKLAASTAPDAPVVEAVVAAGHQDHQGETNPHAWYDPAAVTALADAVTARLRQLAPEAAGYFDERRVAFAEDLKPYHELIDSLKAKASGKSYAATETSFDDMGAALGLTNRTPRGYQVASSNDSEPSPADLDAFLQLLSDRGVDVLIYNVQTEGSVPQQLRMVAEQSGVPVVEITETLPPDADSFLSWQVDQLIALGEALGVGS
ncbi:ABC transporter substrate-binding protein [Mycolicibacterium novocastrense]|uniref:metal ABC transporter solute-binding protein, Zn/Mn family n=1 Tax=Mycolicibacterium novocastrense TaxID=59813 RepID=UPI0007462F57|nr:zinc ABC transporter substrate-binding protein [Mycolicibacterium novocastrense]KUH74231.1 ABC transporter substrate-binding protein [Mycolicibacterium novocastrense]KUH75449.1 ABC transporter substrate-binding protein [Mycolicibacterium novocastrense]KUH76459.1 ABC transporter substrate-binding protein [Mycolicibacterium novocastrense]